jgi:hypothetical protein
VNDFSLRPDGKKTALDQPWSDNVPWAAFGSARSPYVLLCVSHQQSQREDSYVRWPYAPDSRGEQNLMTVFGFGRPGWKSANQHQPQLTELPARFTIAISKGATVEQLAKQLSASGGSPGATAP